MDTLVKVFAPRNALDFLFKGLLVLVVLGAMNWTRDQIEHGEAADRFLNNFWEAAIVGVLPTILALLLIGHLNALQKRLAKAAVTDPLTGLPNRRRFFEQASGVLPEPGGVLLMLDADHFKDVNDTLGHGAGDRCLVQIAALLNKHIRAGDVVARLGGEEFAVLLVGARHEDARLIGNRLVSGVDLDPAFAKEPHKVTLSIGAIHSDAASDVARLLSIADSALYQAKAAGRARLVFADDTFPPNSPTAIGPREAA